MKKNNQKNVVCDGNKLNVLKQSLDTKDIDDFYNDLQLNYCDIPYKTADGKVSNYKLCDMAKLFVAVSYLVDGDWNNINKRKYRKDAYKVFFEEDRQSFANAWKFIDMLNCQSSDSEFTPVYISILKGGAFKIKQYYHENNNLKSIRGASMLLEYVQDVVVSNEIGNRFIPELILYAGGGNIMCMLPDCVDEDFAVELENKALKYLVNASVAYCICHYVSLVDLFHGDNSYIDVMRKTDNELNRRRKIKIIDSTNEESVFLDDKKWFEYNGKAIDLKNGTKICTDGKICSLCDNRQAKYERKQPDGEALYLCAGCLHKYMVGDGVKSAIFEDYKKKYCSSMSSAKLTSPVNIYNIANDNDNSDNSSEHYAIIYADGNNIGGLIRGIKNIAQMMSFSRMMKSTTKNAVFEALNDCKVKKFEVVGLGGDDVFILVPGKKAFEVSVKLINYYNQSLKNYASTMSVGICIAKAKLSVRTVLEEAENLLSEAKRFLRKSTEQDKGSLSFTVMDSDGSRAESDSKTKSMRPYTYYVAVDMLKNIERFKCKQINIASIRNFAIAFDNIDNLEEAKLYYKYQTARDNALRLGNICGYSIVDGCVEKNGVIYNAWRDILELMNFVGRV